MYSRFFSMLSPNRWSYRPNCPSLCRGMSLVYILIQVYPFKIKILKYLENDKRYAETEKIFEVFISGITSSSSKRICRKMLN